MHSTAVRECVYAYLIRRHVFGLVQASRFAELLNCVHVNGAERRDGAAGAAIRLSVDRRMRQAHTHKHTHPWSKQQTKQIAYVLQEGLRLDAKLLLSTAALQSVTQDRPA